MLDDPPAVVEFETTYDELQQVGALTGGFQLSELLPYDLLSSTGIQVAEVAVPMPFAPDRGRMRVREVPRRVQWDVFAQLLGLDQKAFVRAAEAGTYGPPGSGRPAWWPLSTVEALLAEKDTSITNIVGCDCQV